MKNANLRKMTACAMITAVGVIGATFSVPVGVSRCYPMQSFLNILTAVLFGPWWAVLTAFVISLLRNVLGVGTILAFPGSMFGALLAGLLYKLYPKFPMACIGEIIGTGFLGAVAVFPLAKFIMGKDVAAYAYVIPFLIAAVVGAVFAVVLILILGKTGLMKKLKALFGNEAKPAHTQK